MFLIDNLEYYYLIYIILKLCILILKRHNMIYETYLLYLSRHSKKELVCSTSVQTSGVSVLSLYKWHKREKCIFFLKDNIVENRQYPVPPYLRYLHIHMSRESFPKYYAYLSHLTLIVIPTPKMSP